MSLAKALKHKVNKLSNIDRKWVMFVKDHSNYLKDMSNVVVVDDAMAGRYKYKLNHLLRDNFVSDETIWLVKEINQKRDMDILVTGDQLHIPSNSQITDLFRLFRTSNNSST